MVREYLNLEAVEWVQSLMAARTLRLGAACIAECLQTLVDQMDSNRSFQAKYTESARSVEIGVKGRRYAFQQNHLSAFSFAKIVRYACRMGMGGAMVDLDIRCSYFRAALKLASGWSMQTPAVAAVVRDRDMVIRELLEPFAPNRDYKELLISAGFGKAPEPWWPPFLLDVADEFRALASRAAAECPVAMKQVKTWGRKQPEITLLSHILAGVERGQLDLMIAVAGDSLMSVEHDGIVLWQPDAATLEAVRGSTSFELAVKPYPQTRGEFLDFCRERYPDEDWTSPSRFPWISVQIARHACMQLIQPEEGKRPAAITAHTDFALVVAAEVEGLCVVDKAKTFSWDARTSQWKEGDTYGVHGNVREALHKAFTPKRLVLEETDTGLKAVMALRGGTPAVLKNHGGLVSIREETKAYLTGSIPDTDTTRDVIPFKNEWVWLFKKGVAVRKNPGMVFTRSLPWDYAEWSRPAVHQREFRACMDELFKWEKENMQFRDVPPMGQLPIVDLLPGTDWPGNQALADRMALALRAFPGVGYLLNVWHVDCTIYFLKMLCRALSSADQFCESLHIHGPPRSGKDLIQGLLAEMFGKRDKGGFTGGLPEDMLLMENRASRGPTSPEACQPFRAGVEGCRLVLVPDMKEGALDMAFLKPMVEQAGCPVTTRDLKGRSTQFTPSYLIMTASNFQPKVFHPVIAGSHRRVNVLRMESRFAMVADPEAGVQQGDFGLKARSKTPEYMLDLFHVAKEFFRFFELYGDKLPQPEQVRLETVEIFEQDVQQVETVVERPWHLRLFGPADTTEEAYTEGQVKLMAAQHLGVKKGQATNVLRELGFMDGGRDSTGRKRVMRYKFPDCERAVYVGKAFCQFVRTVRSVKSVRGL